MSATPEMKTQLRRMIAEPTKRHYDDDALATYIQQHPLFDLDGNSPFVEDTDGTLITNPNWTPTYDLNATAADIWLEKSSRATEDNYDHQESSNGRTALWQGKSTITTNAMKMHRLYNARRAAKSTRVHISDDPNSSSSSKL